MVAEVGARREFPPLGSLKIKHVYHEVPPIELQVVDRPLVCERCRARWAKGQAPLPTHPGCASHLAAGD